MSLEDMLKELRHGYLVELDDKVQAITKFLEDAQIAKMRDSFHNLKGSGTTYGVPEITLIASRLETLCENPTSDLTWAVETALHLIKKVQTACLTATEFEIESDTDFQRLNKLAP